MSTLEPQGEQASAAESEHVFETVAKQNGAFYTSDAVATFLSRWTMAWRPNAILEPCFGGAVFIRALQSNAGEHTATITGVELSREAYLLARRTIRVGGTRFINADFFDFASRRKPEFDAVIGNPPFVRYQRFSGAARQRALDVAARSGVELSRLASSWAAFVVGSVSLIRSGGTLAFVVPAEFGYAKYARPVLALLRRSFRVVTIVTSRERFFPDLAEDTYLLLCEDRRFDSAASFRVCTIERVDHLHTLDLDQAEPIDDVPGFIAGRQRIQTYFLPRTARILYAQLSLAPTFSRLREIADVGIGYVSGANDFFHLSLSDAKDLGIPLSLLQPTLNRGRALRGVIFHIEDWMSAWKTGDAGYLLHIRRTDELNEGVRSYIEHGEREGFSKSHKCSSRDPWYCVPHVYRSDAFLTSMSGGFPRLVVNAVNVMASNSVHIVRLHGGRSYEGAHRLAGAFLSTVSQLSCEIEGHSLGGGMLKLEPTEAESVLVPRQTIDANEMAAVLDQADHLIRTGEHERSFPLIDDALMPQSGLAREDMTVLRDALSVLRSRRLGN